jgi:hypothetical protein
MNRFGLCVGGNFLDCFQITDIASVRRNNGTQDFAGVAVAPPLRVPPVDRRGVLKSRVMPMNSNSVLDEESDQAVFEAVTDEEIICLWRSIKGRGISENEAWKAVVIGLALDGAFAKSKPFMQIEQ